MGILQAQPILCPDNLAFENGNFSNWTCYTGSTVCAGGNNTTSVSVSPPIVGRHTIISRTTPSALDPYGLFPINPPDGSNYCVKLGNTQIGAEAERISYTISIPATVTNYSVNFRYAVVFEDPNHSYCEQPRFTARLFDPITSTYLPCGSFEFVSSAALPGFVVSTINPDVKYKPWASAFINLGAYAGRTLQLEFTTVDCTKRGHWGYAYVDVDNICDLSAQMTYACSSNTALLTAPSGFQGYNWWNNNYSTLIGTTQSLALNPAPPPGSVFWVEVLPYNGVGCRDTLPVKVTQAFPIASFPALAAQCQSNNAYRFTSNSTIPVGNIANCSWDFGDGNSGAGDTIIHTFGLPGTYTVKLVVTSDLGCRDSTYRTVVVNPMPVAMFDAPASQCLTSNNFIFTAINPPNSPPATNYNWLFGDGQYGSGLNSSHAYSTDGVFNVKLKVSSSTGCQDSTTRSITVHPQPVAAILTPSGTEFCEGKSVQISASGGQTYQWYKDGQLIPNVNTNLLNVNTAGNYKVNAISSFGCIGTATAPVQLTILNKPVVDFEFPLKCEGSPLTFTDRSVPANSGSLSWQWSFGDNSTSFTQHPSHTYTWGGNYKVTLTVTPSRCPDLTATVTKKVPVEKARLGIRYPTINAIEDVSTHLFARKFGASYLWEPATGLTDTKIYNPVYLGKTEREYTVKITTPLGCTTIDTQLVMIFKQIDIIAPKGFTPNGDGHNDKLQFFLLGIDQLNFFRVFNRWGQLMFETTDPYQFWDGKYKGIDQPLETYVWMAQGRGRDGKTIVRRGQTILIR
jgi:gliding motility-associated-like protein